MLLYERSSKVPRCACVLCSRRNVRARVHFHLSIGGTAGRERTREKASGRARERVVYTYIYICIYMQVYIAIVPCFHSFAERSKELCRRGIKSLNDASMKEGSIGTRNCTVNTEKNVVTGRRRTRGRREQERQKELKRKGKDSENGKAKKEGTGGVLRVENLAGKDR